MKTSYMSRALAMLASAATTFVLFQAVASIGHPAGVPATADKQLACLKFGGGAT